VHYWQAITHTRRNYYVGGYVGHGIVGGYGHKSNPRRILRWWLLALGDHLYRATFPGLVMETD
jgi:hypothetical protein